MWKQFLIHGYKYVWRITEGLDGTYLELTVTDDENEGFLLPQQQYIENSLKYLTFKEGRKLKSPITTNQLGDIRDEMQNKAKPQLSENEIRSHIGKLLWIGIYTITDIWLTVSRLASAICLRSETPEKVITREWRCLRQAKHHGLHYTKSGNTKINNLIREVETKTIYHNH